ncbi:MAG: peptidoglycan-binding protein [bacterium]
MQLKRIPHKVRMFVGFTSFFSLFIISSMIFVPLSVNANGHIGTTLYYNNAAATWDWNTLGNWWKDPSFTVPATQLPTSSDDVVVSADVYINNGSTPITVHNLTVTGTTLWAAVDVIVLGTGSFNDATKMEGGHITGTMSFNDNARLMYSGYLTGNLNFTGHASDEANTDGSVTFSNYAQFSGSPITGDAVFSDSSNCFSGMILGNVTYSSTNQFSGTCTANGNATFYGTTSNDATILGNATFNDTTYNTGSISGNTTFDTTYYSGSIPTAGIFAVTGTNQFFGTYGGLLLGGDGTPLSTFLFSDDTYDNVSLTGNATFTGNAFGNAPLTGNVILHDHAQFNRTVTGNVELHDHAYLGSTNTGNTDVYFPVRLPVTPPTGTLTYHNYPAYFFGWAGDGDWNNLANWKRDSNGNVDLNALPGPTDTVEIRSDITSNSGAPASVLSFTDFGYNVGIPITETNGASFRSGSNNTGAITGNVSFYDSSTNNGSIIGNASFYEDGPEFQTGDVSGTKYRIYQATESTTRDFTQNEPWTVVADGAGNVVDASGSTFDNTTTFAETNGGTIFYGHVLPTVTTLSETAITRTTATLNASLNVTGTDAASDRGFNWGPTTDYGTVVTESAGPYSTGSFTTNLVGLTCSTTYHYQAWATNITGTNVTNDAQFTTSACPSRTLTYTAGAHGTLTGTATQTVADGGDGSAVTAVPSTGYHFVDWSDASTQNPRTDLSVSGDITVSANFAITNYTLTYTAGAHGTLTGTTSQTLTDGTNGSAVTAVPSSGYHFVDWSDASTQNPRTDLAVHGNITVSANFAITNYTLTYTAGAHGSLTGTTTQTIASGADGSAVTAVPDSGYAFTAWSDASTQNPRTDTAVSDDLNLSATFTLVPVVIRSSGGGGAPALLITPRPAPTQVVLPVAPQVNTPLVQKNNGSVLIGSQASLFSKNLKLGSNDPEVKKLQVFLNTHGFTIAQRGAGSSGKETTLFGTATKNALTRFQNAHAKEILTPNGLKSGNGIWGAATRAYVNSL